MCGTYGYSQGKETVYDRFEVVNKLDDLRNSWRIKPGQKNPVITSHSPNQISRMLWGFIPRHAKFKTQFSKYSTINAKKRDLLSHPFIANRFENTAVSFPPIFSMSLTKYTFQ